MRRSILVAATVALSLITAAASVAQPLPKKEFRGAWIATVINLDWPTSRNLTSAQQQSTLERLIDKLHAAGINAIFFQIRAESDALYDSPYEPWSYWLTGESGKAPSPFYDPLTFAVQEAHKRGMELHAWFNPFRANRNVSGLGSYPFDASHVTIQHPDWILTINNDIAIVDPGIPAARQYVIDVIADVVARYDIDGVHFDDYFYPYPPNQIADQDLQSFTTYGGGFSSVADWRRDNINTFVREVHEQISAVKADMKFGISPFGIWRNGTPSGIVGLDAYSVIYADAVTWMQSGWIDYLVPQLYWPFGDGQDYAKLAPWWVSVSNGRHIYPGHALYKSEPSTWQPPPGAELYGAEEVPLLVRFNRANDIPGSVFFRARNITDFTSKGFADSLSADLYRYPALTPSFDWSEQVPPPVPIAFSGSWVSDFEFELTWDTPFPDPFQPDARRFAVYRVRAASPPDLAAAMLDPAHLLGVTGDTDLVDVPPAAPEPYHNFVAGVNSNSVESGPSDFVTVDGRAVPIESVDLPAASFALRQNFPNPFGDYTVLQFSMLNAGAARLSIFDSLGREVAVLLDGAWHAAGTYEIRWDGTDGSGVRVAGGTYFAELASGGRRVVRPMIKVK